MTHSARQGWSLSWGFWAIAVLVPVSFLVVFFAWPVAGLISRGFVIDGVFSLDGLSAVLSSPRTWRIIGQTLALAVAGTLASDEALAALREKLTGN